MKIPCASVVFYIMKFVFISGGVISGLGKGVTTASLGLLLKSRGLKVTAVKCDMYLNIDAGTMNPLEHGEVFVTHDGLETDQDLGHYERFLEDNHLKVNYMTNGQLYQQVLDKERALEYDGICVQPYHHIPPEIIKRWKAAGKAHDSDIVLIELGGTVGEYEGLLFFESARRLKQKNPGDVVFIHIGYLPAPPSIGELKSKPVQQSVGMLNSLGIQPDFIIGRAEKPIDKVRKYKISLASGVEEQNVISNHDVACIYKIPLVLNDQKLDEKVIKALGLKPRKQNMKPWIKMLKMQDKANSKVKVGIVGKYQQTGDYTLEDAYVCVVEALKHASWQFGLVPEIIWINSESLEKASDLKDVFDGIDGILVPQGWGKRGVEGKIKAVKYAREHNIPFLGLCFGMQMATIEYGRNVVGLKNANSEEINKRTKNPVIHIMDDQKKLLKEKKYGGTIRLGAWPAKLQKGTRLKSFYKKYGNAKSNAWYEPTENSPKKVSDSVVYERHRHRYEFNNKYKKKFENAGLVISATSPDGKLVEAIELPKNDFFVATQYHPEYESRPLHPHPIFTGFIKAASER